jgi:hypothetical protein
MSNNKIPEFVFPNTMPEDRKIEYIKDLINDASEFLLLSKELAQYNHIDDNEHDYV